MNALAVPSLIRRHLWTLPMTIELTPIKARQIHAVGYDPASQTLAIQFLKKDAPGVTYHYANVSPEQADAFIKAEDPYEYFAQHIRWAIEQHPYHRVD